MRFYIDWMDKKNFFQLTTNMTDVIGVAWEMLMKEREDGKCLFLAAANPSLKHKILRDEQLYQSPLYIQLLHSCNNPNLSISLFMKYFVKLFIHYFNYFINNFLQK